MDQLETLTIPTETVTFGNQSIELRGLGFADLTFIVREHKSMCAELYVRAIKGEMTDNVQELALALVNDFGPVVAMVIACASDSPNSAAKAARLPLSTQIAAIEKIFTLTLVGEDGLEKLMETVIRALSGTASLTSRAT
jgi:hypothetical protein